jgi:hypothetical protein
MTARQLAHRKEKERIKQRLRDEPDSEWAITFRAKRREEKKRWYKKNPGLRSRYNKKYRELHLESSRARAAKWKARKRFALGVKPRKKLTPEEKAAYHKKWWSDNRERLNARSRERRASDPSFKIRCNLRARLSMLVRKSATSKTSRTFDLLGCSLPSFMIYLESKFEIGMAWGNYGKWHIDHIMPCAIFDLTKVDHQKRCFHFSNMQPLWAVDNRRKSDSLPHPTETSCTPVRHIDLVRSRIRFTL